MGGEDARRKELWRDIDVYLSQRNKSSGALSGVFSSKYSSYVSSSQPMRQSRLSSGLHHAHSSLNSRLKPKLKSRFSPSFAVSLQSAWSQGTSAWWEGFKSSLKQTVQHDLSRVKSTGGTLMKTDQHEFMDFGEEGLTVVPIPEEVEPAQMQPSVLKPQLNSSLPLKASVPSNFSEGSALPQLPKQGWFSRWFAKKQVVKQERLLDEDFLLSSTVDHVQSGEADRELRDDFKELAKLCLKNLERMNKDQLSQYRSTPEFDRFKELLRKHNVIK